jgi:DnaK suppressor protein
MAVTAAQLKQFRARLEREQSSLREQLNELRRDLAFHDETETPSDPSDAATMLVNQSEILGQIGQLEETLAQVEKALQRMDEGTYGLSEVSGKPIPVERLEALPYATTLVDEGAPATGR